MKKHVVLAVACLFIVVFNCGCLESREGKVITMTMEEFVNDYDQDMDNDTKKFTSLLKSLDDGDTLIIKDKINNMTYIGSYDYTPVEFESLLGIEFRIEGDITSRFRIGDNIELKLHIIKVTYPEQNSYTGEIWTIEQEIFREGWDIKNNTYIPISQEYIIFSDSGEGKVVTMTLWEFTNDYDRSIDNNTKKITIRLESLNHGDTLIISDTINNITYVESNNFTGVEFESLIGKGLTIGGDITDRFEKGDNVKITMHAIKVIFTQQIDNETWTIEVETFKEEWDSENNIYIPIPQKHITHT